MTIRAETTAATRAALLAAASALLAEGGADAVTLRAVGDRAGVSRSAPYRHFASKQAMLDAISTYGWADLSARMELIAADERKEPRVALRAATEELAHVARTRPNLYRLMLSRIPTDPDDAAARTHDVFFALVARVARPARAADLAGLLIAAVHGIADLELSGYMDGRKPGTDGGKVIDLLIDVVQDGGSAVP